MRTFIRHYIEMLIAMVFGMFVLGIPVAGLLGVAGVDVSAWETDHARADAARHGVHDERPHGRVDALPRPWLGARLGDDRGDVHPELRGDRSPLGRPRRRQRHADDHSARRRCSRACWPRCSCVSTSTQATSTMRRPSMPDCARSLLPALHGRRVERQALERPTHRGNAPRRRVGPREPRCPLTGADVPRTQQGRAADRTHAAVPTGNRRPAGGLGDHGASSSQKGTGSHCGSRRSPSASATRRCGCWPTTARSPAPR